MYQVIIVVHVLLGLGVIGLILMQQGKGADAGAAFGSGSSGSVFGAQGAASFLSRTTAILATLFFTTSLTLAVFNSHQSKKADLMDTVEVEQKTVDIPLADKSAPATPAAAAPATDTPVVANDAAVPAVAVTATPATPPVAGENAVATENKDAKPAVENKGADVAPEKSEKPADTAEKKKDEAVEQKADDKKAEKKSSDKHAKKHQSDADKKDKK